MEAFWKKASAIAAVLVVVLVIVLLWPAKVERRGVMAAFDVADGAMVQVGEVEPALMALPAALRCFPPS